MKKVLNKVGTVCLYIAFFLSAMFFAYMAVIEGVNIPW
jgi:hypothetical protein